MKFTDLGLAEPLLRALAAADYTTPTPIQAQAIPELLKGRDMLGIAQTGTGKTAAFALPILQRLSENKEHVGPKATRALILAPTRELAVQIGDALKVYGRQYKLRHTVILGGVSQHGQVRALARGLDIVVATPGRLMDLLNQRHIRLDKVSHLVLDEADRMLDMGFIRDVRKIVAALPQRRQSLLFSATMPTEVAKLAGDMLHNPLRVEVTPKVVTVERIAQSVHHVSTADKRTLLENLLADPAMKRVIVFTRTKHRANRVAEQLDKAGISADAIHGNKSQNARQKALDAFRKGRARVLVATDIAARGIDVSGITHVINYELPNEPESYVHRIGRTARAGAEGAAISFCDATERAYLRDIERLIKLRLEVIGDAPANDNPARRPARKNGPRPQQRSGQRQGNGERWAKSGNGKGKPQGKPYAKTGQQNGNGAKPGSQGSSEQKDEAQKNGGKKRFGGKKPNQKFGSKQNGGGASPRRPASGGAPKGRPRAA
ncbi:DEAD/DEAH box helicase [Pelagibius litoralis]|uniref:DEAD-box ATP-dependent RNA helicase RhpA n=1 Tax=Pelagibius litoralis TaxID=374515 RepID=A0A967KB13_9PROT|nr:DEAD/DEAH box helicase [Pelagibius litoralis]NIA70797.1 DEAD/DEAH box helicase [Pelagibius litoralis]